MPHHPNETNEIIAPPDNLQGSEPTRAREINVSEDEFWLKQYEREYYFQHGLTYEDYQPAYQLGYEAHERAKGRTFEENEHDLQSEWDKVKAKSRLKWEHAKHAVKAAWDRKEHKKTS